MIFYLTKVEIMSLKQKIKELQKKREEVFLGGGEKAIKKQAAMGKMTARERVISLLDEDSFQEYDLFAEHEARGFNMESKTLHGDGVIIGTGKIYGAPICIYAQDFTVAGGSLGLMHSRKITKIMDHSMKMRVPLIGINDSVMLNSLAGSRLGVWVAHGEGKFELPMAEDDYNIPVKYGYKSYPGNPNGSYYNAAAVCSKDGRHLAMMPHLERAIFNWQWANYPENRKADEITPWFEAFVNAREWILSN